MEITTAGCQLWHEYFIYQAIVFAQSQCAAVVPCTLCQTVNLRIDLPLHLCERTNHFAPQLRIHTDHIWVNQWLPIKRTILIGVSSPVESFLFVVIAVRKVKVQAISVC